MTEQKLTLDQAIQTAIEYETNVRDLYRTAVEQATEQTGKKLFGRLADEEQGHLDYLVSRFDEWERTGKISSPELARLVPNSEQIKAGMAKLDKSMKEYDWHIELGLLKKALQVESETGGFYKRMTQELDAEGASMFAKFLEIEDAHYDLVQAQLDALNGPGFWFDFMEFDLEAG